MHHADSQNVPSLSDSLVKSISVDKGFGKKCKKHVNMRNQITRWLSFHGAFEVMKAPQFLVSLDFSSMKNTFKYYIPVLLKDQPKSYTLDLHYFGN